MLTGAENLTARLTIMRVQMLKAKEVMRKYRRKLKYNLFLNLEVSVYYSFDQIVISSKLCILVHVLVST